MSTHNALKWLIPPILVLALVAAVAGLWLGDGTSYPLTTFRGEQVTINARGLYYWDTVSTAAQMQANDLVTLIWACRCWRSLSGWHGVGRCAGGCC